MQVTDWEPTEGNPSTELLQNTRGMLLSMRGLGHLAGGEGEAGGLVAAGVKEGREGKAKKIFHEEGKKGIDNGTYRWNRIKRLIIF